MATYIPSFRFPLLQPVQVPLLQLRERSDKSLVGGSNFLLQLVAYGAGQVVFIQAGQHPQGHLSLPTRVDRRGQFPGEHLSDLRETRTTVKENSMKTSKPQITTILHN